MKTQQKCVDRPTTSSGLDFDCEDDNIFDFDVLQCPLCARQLDAIELDITDVEGEKFQRIWWTCSGLKTQSCHFPTFLPENVFWTQRTMMQMRNGFYPLPNLHLLPRKYWKLYPKFFDVEKGPVEGRSLDRKVQKLANSMTSGGKFVVQKSWRDGKEDDDGSVDFRPSTSNDSNGPFSAAASEMDDLDSSVQSISDVVVLEDDIQEANVGKACVSHVESDTSVTGNDGTFVDADGGEAIDERDFTVGRSDLRANQVDDVKELASASPIRKSSGDSCVGHSAEGSGLSEPVEKVTNGRFERLKRKRKKNVGALLLADERNEDADVQQRSDGEEDASTSNDNISSGIMSRLTRKHQRLIQKQKAILDARRIALKTQIKKRGYTLDPSVVPFEDLSSRRKPPSTHLPLVDEGVPAEDILEDKEDFEDCFDYNEYLKLVKRPKEEPLDDGFPRRKLVLEGSPTPFRPEHFPSSVIDPQNWYHPVLLTGRTALDGFLAWYNLRFNRKQYMECLSAEMCKKGVLKFIPSIPIKQQRMVKQLHAEVHGRKLVDIEKMKKSFDSTTLRLQMAHRLGVPNVEPLLDTRASTSREHEKDVDGGFHREMQVIGSVPLGKAPLYSVHNQSSIAETKGCSSFSSAAAYLEQAGTSSDTRDLRKSTSLPDLEKLNLPKHLLNMMSDCVITGNSAVDEFLHRKVVTKMKQVVEDKETQRKESALVRQRPEVHITEGPPAKQKRLSEGSQRTTRESSCYDNLEGIFNEYYDDDEEFCAQIYGSQNL